MQDQVKYHLSDEVIAHIAKVLQLAILSGTDIVDHLRMVGLVNSQSDPTLLVLSDEYKEISESQVEKMLSEVEQYREQIDN